MTDDLTRARQRRDEREIAVAAGEQREACPACFAARRGIVPLGQHNLEQLLRCSIEMQRR